MFDCKKTTCFMCGALAASLGVKLLTSREAKKVYAHVTAAALRAKEEVMTTVTCVKENAGDILADAKQINENRAAASAEEVIPDAVQE